MRHLFVLLPTVLVLTIGPGPASACVSRLTQVSSPSAAPACARDFDLLAASQGWGPCFDPFGLAPAFSPDFDPFGLAQHPRSNFGPESRIRAR